MPKNRSDDEDVMENETAIPEPPNGTPTEVSRAAWRVAWSASNAAAGYHASIINHLVAHEKTIKNTITAELQQMRAELGRDFRNFRLTLVESLRAVGIRIDLSPSGEHAQVKLGDVEPGRERVASSHDLEEGLAEVSERIEDQLDERFRDLGRLKGADPIPSDRVRGMLAQERAAIEAHFEAEQRIMRLELEKRAIEVASAGELRRVQDQRAELAEANTRWLRVAFMIAGGVVTVLAALLIWALTKQVPPAG